MNGYISYEFSDDEKLAYERLSNGISIHQTHDNDFETLLVSDGLCKLYGRTSEMFIKMLNNREYEAIFEEDRLIVADFVNELIKSNHPDTNITYRLNSDSGEDYTYLHADAKSMTMEDGTELIVVTHSSLNKYTQNSATDSLIKSVKKNEYLVAELDNMKKSNLVRQKFISNISHDMRTPINAVLSISKFGIEEIENELALKYFSEIRSSAEYLLNLINEVSDYHSVEREGVELKEKPVLDIKFVNSIINIVKPRAIEKGINLIVELPDREGIYRWCDETRCQQIIINLLSNAIKYTHQGGTVTWQEELIQRDGALFEKHVFKDNGVGMSKLFQESLFEPYSRENNGLSDNEGGTGLGLTITKKIIDAMGGSILCESDLGIGTTFYVELPMKIATPEQIRGYSNKEDNEKNAYTNLAGKRALLAEDSSINTKILVKILESYGMIVSCAKTGKECVEKAELEDYDFILTDIRMPIMDGIAATKTIRKFNKKTPIIGLSGETDSSSIQKALSIGMDAYLFKPVDPNLLLQTINKMY